MRQKKFSHTKFIWTAMLLLLIKILIGRDSDEKFFGKTAKVQWTPRQSSQRRLFYLASIWLDTATKHLSPKITIKLLKQMDGFQLFQIIYGGFIIFRLEGLSLVVHCCITIFQVTTVVQSSHGIIVLDV